MSGALLAILLLVPQEIPGDRAKQIRDAAPEKPQAAPKKPRRVLVWNTPLMDKSPHKGYCIPFGTHAFKVLGEKSGAYEAVVSDDLAMYLPENLKTFDAIVMNNSCGKWIEPTDAAMEKLKDRGDKAAVEQLLRKSLLDWVAAGGGIAANHFAIGANPHWPEFRELLGGTFDGHPWNEEVGLKLDEPAHPLAAAFGGKPFRVADEIYQFREPYSREKVRVLVSLDTSATNMGVKWINRKDGDFALAWVKTHGRGRVFYTALGHRTEIYWNPVVLRFYLDGIQFATGDLDADSSPSPKR
jgi:hypothetical protein